MWLSGSLNYFIIQIRLYGISTFQKETKIAEESLKTEFKKKI